MKSSKALQKMNHLKAGLTFLVLLGAGTALAAENHLLQPDFTFKRVTVPSANATSRITVQIDPDAPILDFLPSDPAVPVAPVAAGIGAPQMTPSGYEWFWSAVPAGITDNSPARFDLALSQINDSTTGDTVPAPRLQDMQDIARQHGLKILTETVGTPVSPALVLAVIAVESAGQVDAVSSAGAQGLMQLMPDTATRFGVSDSFDPSENISGGVAYLEWLFDRFENDAVLALAGYNAGEGNIGRYDGVPPFAETRAYVPKVLAAWQVAKGLCVTRPELITDPCIFNVNQG